MEKESILDLLKKISSQAQESQTDATKVLNGTNIAGTRLRKQMQDVKKWANEIRSIVQELKNDK